MNAKTLAATIKSVAKWYRIYRYGAKDHGIDDCALCKLFYLPHCDGCPVKDVTGKKDCHGSPYIEYISAIDDHDRNTHHPAVRRAARAEYEFLKSLLPKGKP